MKEILHPTQEDPSWITEHPTVLEHVEFDVSMVLSSVLFSLSSVLFTHSHSLIKQDGIKTSTQKLLYLIVYVQRSKTSGEISYLIIFCLLNKSFP